MYFQISKYSHNIYIYRLILCQGYKLLLAWDILPDLALAVFCPSFNFRSWQPAGPGFGNISGSLGGSPLPTLDTDRSPWMISETSIILKRNKGGLVNGGLGGLVSLMIHSNGPSCCKTCVWTLAQCVLLSLDWDPQEGLASFASLQHLLKKTDRPAPVQFTAFQQQVLQMVHVQPLVVLLRICNSPRAHQCWLKILKFRSPT